MRVLVACEFSGTVREAFKKKGHDAWSCDLLDTEIPGNHFKGNCLHIINDDWDLIIAHPPCTYLASSGLHWNTKIKGRAKQTEEALQFVKQIMDANCPKICIENPVGCISTRIRKPDQFIQPYMFGHDASKKTCLWLKNLPKLQPTNLIIKSRYANQTPSGQNNLGPSKDRWKLRSLTYQGVADCMAATWG